jgi:hypothetical protein
MVLESCGRAGGLRHERSEITLRPWTSGEENRMSEMLEAGNTAGEIAAELDRTPSAI